MSATRAAAAGNGLVVAAFRRHWRVALDDGTTLDCVQKGRALTLVCGDRVAVARAAGGGVIERVMERSTLFHRSDAAHEKLIAANVDQVLGMVAPDVAIDEHLFNRWIIAAETQACRFIVVAAKADLPGMDALLMRMAPYAALGYTVVSVAAQRSVEPLLPWLRGRHSVLAGQSGMGKSTLINALLPAAAARTGAVSPALGAGRHTTSASTLYRLPLLHDANDANDGNDAWIVDAPGVKSFALGHATPEQLAAAFVELRPLIGHCRFRNCRHRDEPDCAVSAAVQAGRIEPKRLALFHAMVGESLRA
jgi:ribosome biogenesis GTPase